MPDLKDLQKIQPKTLISQEEKNVAGIYQPTPQLLLGRKVQGLEGRLFEQVDNRFLLGGTDAVHEIAAQNQSALDQLGNGVIKFLGKTATAATGAVSMLGAIPVVGALQFKDLITGQDDTKFSEIYDNQVIGFLDGLNKDMDEALPNLRTKVEEEMSIGRQMLTSNFWADDFLGGASFMAGAVVAEMLTGGAATYGLAARAGSLLKGLGKTKNAVDAIKMAEKVSAGSKLFGAIKSTTIGAGYESAIEAYHTKNEITNKLIEKYKNDNGTDPTEQELQNIDKVSSEIANGVFGMNMLTVGMGNAIFMSKIFGAPLKAAIPNSIKDMFGKGLSKIGDEVVDKSVTGWRKYFTGLKRFVINPVTEGTQEILQGLYGSSALEYVMDKYSHDGADATYSMLDALQENGLRNLQNLDKDAMKEGWIGVLLGTIGLPGTGSFLESFKSGWKAIKGVSDYQSEIDRYNSMTPNVKESLKGFIRQSELNSKENNSTLYDAKNSESLSLFNYLGSRYNTGYINDVVSDMQAAMDSMTDIEFAQQYGYDKMSKEEIATRKQSIIENLQEIVAEYKKTRDTAKNIDQTGSEEVQEGLAYTLFGMKDADKRFDSIIESLEKKGIGGKSLKEIMYRGNSITFKKMHLDKKKAKLEKVKKDKDDFIKEKSRSISNLKTRRSKMKIDPLAIYVSEKYEKAIKEHEDTLSSFDAMIAKQEQEVSKYEKETNAFIEQSKKERGTSQIDRDLESYSEFERELKHYKDLNPQDILEIKEQIQDLNKLALRRMNFIDEMTLLSTPKGQKAFQETIDRLKDRINKEYELDVRRNKELVDKYLTEEKSKIQELESTIASSKNQRVKKELSKELANLKSKYAAFENMELESPETSVLQDYAKTNKGEFTSILFKNMYDVIALGKQINGVEDELDIEKEIEKLENEEKVEKEGKKVSKKNGKVFTANEFFILYQGTLGENPYLLSEVSGEPNDEVKQGMIAYENGAAATIVFTETVAEPIPSKFNDDVFIQRGIVVNGKQYFINVFVDVNGKKVDIGGLMNPNRYVMKSKDGTFVPYDLTNPVHFKKLADIEVGSTAHKRFINRYKGLQQFWDNTIKWNIEQGNMSVPLVQSLGWEKDGVTYQPVLNVYSLGVGDTLRPISEIVEEWGIEVNGKKVVFARQGDKNYVLEDGVWRKATNKDIALNKRYFAAKKSNRNNRIGEKGNKGILVNVNGVDKVFPMVFPEISEKEDTTIQEWIKKHVGATTADFSTPEFEGRITAAIKVKGDNQLTSMSFAKLIYFGPRDNDKTGNTMLEIESPALGEKGKVRIRIFPNKSTGEYFLSYIDGSGKKITSTIGKVPSPKNLIDAMSKKLSANGTSISESISQEFGLEMFNLNFKGENIESASTNIETNFSGSFTLIIKEDGDVKEESVKKVFEFGDKTITKSAPKQKKVETTKKKSIQVREEKEDTSALGILGIFNAPETPKTPEPIPDDVPLANPADFNFDFSDKEVKDDDDILFSIKEDPELNSTFEREAKQVQRVLGNVPIEDVRKVMSNISNRGITMGALANGIIYLSKKLDKGTGLHEAFHYVFRGLLTDAELETIYKEAEKKYGKPSKETLLDFRLESSSRKRLSDVQLERLYYEEKLADDFASYGEKNVFVKLFNRIKNFVKSWFTNINEIELLFQNIDTGKYSNKPSKFSSDIVFSLKGRQVVKGEDGKDITKSTPISSKDTKTIASLIFQNIVNDDYSETLIEQRDKQTTAFERSFNRALEKVKGKFDPVKWKPIIAEVAKKDMFKANQLANRLIAISSTLSNDFLSQYGSTNTSNPAIEDNLDELKQLVQQYTALFGYQSIEDEQDDESSEDETGEPTELFSRGSDRGQGFTSLGKIFRQYLGTVHGEMDYFGIGIEATGKQHDFPADVEVLYNALLGFTRNLSEDKIFRNLLEQAKNNPNIQLFVNRWLTDIAGDLNASSVEDFTHEQLRESAWYNTVIKALTRVEEQYVDMVIMPPSRNNPYTKIRFYNSNQTDTEQIQKNNWYGRALRLEVDAQEIWKNLEETFSTLELSDIKEIASLDRLVDEVQEQIDSTGITLSKGFIKYSILKNFEEEINSTQDEKYNDYKNLLEVFDVDVYLDTETIGFIANKYGIIKKQGLKHAENLQDKNLGSSGKFLNLAKSNAMFDETTRKTNLKNSNGESVYPIKLPSFDADLINLWKSTKNVENITFEELQEMFPNYHESILRDYYESLKTNILVKDGIFKRMKLWNLFGIRNEQIEDEVSDSIYGGASEYSEMDASGKMFTKLALYIGSPESVLKDGYRLFIPAVLADKSTSKAVELPIGKFTKGGKLTSAGISAIRQRLYNEANRIERVNQQLQDWIEHGIPIDALVRDYHYRKIGGKKVFKLNDQFYEINKDNTVTPIENVDGYKEVRGLVPFEFTQIDKNSTDEQIQEYFKKEFDKFVEYLGSPEIGLIEKKEDGWKNRLLPIISTESHKDITNIANTNKDINLDRLFDFYASDNINSMHFMSLLYANVAMQHKDFVDVVKRNGGIIGAGENMGSVNVAYIESEEYDIANKVNDNNSTHLIVKNNKKTDVDSQDAQSYTSVNWFINSYLKESGRLSKEVKKIFKKVRAGIPLSNYEFKYLQKQAATTIDKKPVIRDLINYIKTSAHTQLREMYSYYEVSEKKLLDAWKEYDNGKIPIEQVHALYKPYPGYEYHHNMINRMERDGIDMLSTTSAGKNALINVGQHNKETGEFEVSPMVVDKMREQVKMESVKEKIIHSTQTMGLIDSEQDDTMVETMSGQKVKASSIAKAYRKQLANRVELGMNKVRKGLYQGNDPNYDKLSEEFNVSLNSSKPDPMMVEMAKVENGKPVYSWNLAAVSKKFQQIYHKYISTGTLKHKVEGTKYTLVSDYGMEVMVDNNDNVIPRSKWNRKSTPETRPLQWGKKKNGIYYSECIVPKWVLDKYGIEIGDVIEDELLLFQMGVRIPTQDNHSMVTLKVVDVMPSMNETSIIMPAEIVLLSGADFDIDSLFSRFFAVNKGKRIGTYTNEQEAYEEWINEIIKKDKTLTGQIKLIQDIINIDAEFDVDFKNLEVERLLKRKGYGYDQFIKKYGKVVKDNIENRASFNFEKIIPLTIGESDNILLELEIHLVMNEGNKNIAATAASLDLFKDPITGAIKYFEDLGLISNQEASGLYDALSKNEAQKNNDVGKVGIGPVAIFNILFQKLIRAKHNYSKDPIFGKSNLSLINEEAKRLNDIISTVLSAMTDNAKERIAAKFNLTPNTLGTFLTIVSTGIPFKDALLIVNQPVIKALERNLTAQQRTVKSAIEEKEDIKGNSMQRAIELTIRELKLDKNEDYVPKDLHESLVKQEEGNFQRYILDQYLKAHAINEHYVQAARVISLIKGLKPTIGDNLKFSESLSTLGTSYNVTEILDEAPDFKVTPTGAIFKKGNKSYAVELFSDPETWFTKVIESDEHLRNEILSYIVLTEDVGEVFFRQKAEFRNMVGRIRNNLNRYMKAVDLEKMEEQFVAYLNILAYKKSPLANFDYSFLTEKNGEEFVIHQVLSILQADPSYKNSPLIQMMKGVTNKAETLGKIIMDTQSEQSPDFKKALLDDYVSLLDPAIKDVSIQGIIDGKASVKEMARWFAKSMFIHTFIMDNMMFRNNSLVKSLDPVVWKTFAQSMQEIEDTFKGRSTWLKSTNMTKKQVENDFTELYLRNPSRFKSRIFASAKSIRKRDGRTVTVTPFGKESKTFKVFGTDWLTFDKGKVTIDFTTRPNVKGFKEHGEDYYKLALKADAENFGLYTSTIKTTPLIFNYKGTGESPNQVMRLETINVVGKDGLYQYKRLPDGKAMEFKLYKNKGYQETGVVLPTMPREGFKFEYTPTTNLLDGNFVGYAQTIQEAEELTSKLQPENKDEVGKMDFGISDSGTSSKFGENISSKGSELAKKLTNPGNNLTVKYKGKTFRNAEHAYQTWKSGTFDEKAFNSSAFKPIGSKPANKNTNYQTMVDILTAKLQQHPSLITEIISRGGIDYIKNSTHNVTGDKFWESSGQNKFIEALSEAFYNVVEESEIEKTQPEKNAYFQEIVDKGGLAYLKKQGASKEEQKAFTQWFLNKNATTITESEMEETMQEINECAGTPVSKMKF